MVWFGTLKQLDDGLWYASLRRRLPDEDGCTNRIHVVDGEMFKVEDDARTWLINRLEAKSGPRLLHCVPDK